jgi:hypothetical protein
MTTPKTNKTPTKYSLFDHVSLNFLFSSDNFIIFNRNSFSIKFCLTLISVKEAVLHFDDSDVNVS